MRVIITCIDCGHSSRIQTPSIPASFAPKCSKCGSEKVFAAVLQTWQEYKQHEQEIAEVREQADRMVREALSRGL